MQDSFRVPTIVAVQRARSRRGNAAFHMPPAERIIAPTRKKELLLPLRRKNYCAHSEERIIAPTRKKELLRPLGAARPTVRATGTNNPQVQQKRMTCPCCANMSGSVVKMPLFPFPQLHTCHALVTCPSSVRGRIGASFLKKLLGESLALQRLPYVSLRESLRLHGCSWEVCATLLMLRSVCDSLRESLALAAGSCLQMTTACALKSHELA